MKDPRFRGRTEEVTAHELGRENVAYMLAQLAATNIAEDCAEEFEYHLIIELFMLVPEFTIQTAVDRAIVATKKAQAKELTHESAGAGH